MADLVEAYRNKAPSYAQKFALALAHLVAGSVAAWMLFGGGVEWLSSRLGMESALATSSRRGLLLAAALIYSLRLQATTFVFIKRQMEWAEAATIGIWVIILNLLFAFFGGRHGGSLGALAPSA